MGCTVYIFSYQVAAVIVDTIDTPSDAAQRLAQMVRKLNPPSADEVVQTSAGGLSLAFLMAHENSQLLDTYSINNSMRVETIARISGAERYYTVDVHSHQPSAIPIVTGYMLRDNMVVADGVSDTLPAFIKRHGNGTEIRSISCPDGYNRLVHGDDLPRYLAAIDASLALPGIGDRRARWLTELRQTLMLK